MNLSKIKEEFHQKYLRARIICDLVMSPDFEAAYITASLEERNEVLKNVHPDTIRIFIKQWKDKATPFEKMGLRRLRLIASNLHIKNYSRLDKITMLKEINHAVQKVKDCAARITVQPKGQDSIRGSAVCTGNEQRRLLAHQSN